MATVPEIGIAEDAVIKTGFPAPFNTVTSPRSFAPLKTSSKACRVVSVAGSNDPGGKLPIFTVPQTPKQEPCGV